MAAVLILAALTGIPLMRRAAAQESLTVTYSAHGIQQLTYNGIVLEDLQKYPSDLFHIGHMKLTDLHGKVISSGEYGWGETNRGRTWDAAAKSWIYAFVWGSIQVSLVQRGNSLDMTVKETNLANSGVVLDGAVIDPLVLHLPRLPAGFHDSSYPQLAFNTTGPGVTIADYGAGEIAAVVPDAAKALYSGFWPRGDGIAYIPIISGTAPDGLATFQPHNDRPVLPGGSDTFTVSLRFAPSTTSPKRLAADAYAGWRKMWPSELHWSDRRAIGTIFLANSPSGDAHRPAGYPNNPRRYFNDSDAMDFDITTPSGLAAFQARVLQQAESNVANLRKLNAQGSITWDIEGEQYPQSTSYVCEPDKIAQIAPEMESTIADHSSRFYGMKLDDAYFKTMTAAGFRVGVCVRPQHFVRNEDGTAQQLNLPNSAVAAELIRKIRFAHERWGATLFYVDSSVESDGAVLDAGIFHQVAQAFPDSLIIPEEATPKYYAYTAPFQTFLNHGDLGIDPLIRACYPQAFSVNMINDADPVKLAAMRPQLIQSIKDGNILMGHADYWQANDSAIVSMYQAAGVRAPRAASSRNRPRAAGGAASF